MNETIAAEMCSKLTQEDIDQLRAALSNRANELIECQPIDLIDVPDDGGDLREPTTLGNVADKLEAGEAITTTDGAELRTSPTPCILTDNACVHWAEGHMCASPVWPKPADVARDDKTLYRSCDQYMQSRGHTPEVDPDDVRAAAADGERPTLLSMLDDIRRRCHVIAKSGVLPYAATQELSAICDIAIVLSHAIEEPSE